jgi:capsular polysaccharide transport system permease protein
MPTIIAGWYFYRVATPVYATYTEFVIQQADQKGGGGLGGLFAGTGLRHIAGFHRRTGLSAIARGDAAAGGGSWLPRKHFQNPDIDPLQRLEADASLEAPTRSTAKLS